MKEIVYYNAFDGKALTMAIRHSGSVFDVLVLYSYYAGTVIDICPENPSHSPLLNGREGVPAEPLFNVPHLSKLQEISIRDCEYLPRAE